jgi:glycosyl transferase family 10 (putative fucosyltransferase)
MLVLFFNRMFGQAPELPLEEFELGWEVTEDRTRFAEADAVIFHIPTLQRFLFKRKRPGQLWVAWSMESEVHYPRLSRPSFMRRFDLEMTYRLSSDVRAHYIPGGIDEPLSMPIEALLEEKDSSRLVCSLISAFRDRSGRGAYVRELGRHLDLHTYGRWGKRKIKNDRGRESKLELIRGYKFNLAFENSIAHDYVSEKLYDPLLVGCVPVYLGAPNVEDFAPTENCFVNTADFAGPRELAAYLLELDADDAAYRELIGWRERPTKPEFEALHGSDIPHCMIALFRQLSERLNNIR